MRIQLLSKKIGSLLALTLLMSMLVLPAYADPVDLDDMSMDRIELVSEQISLLKNRLNQSRTEFTDLQRQHDKDTSQYLIEKVSKTYLDKAGLDIAVTKSNLDSVNIELADCQQMISWLEKSSQEIENQLNILNIFGLKVANNDIANIQQLHADLNYQKQLLALEKMRVSYLQKLQTVAGNIGGLRKDNYNRLNTLLKSRNMLHLKQQQVRDELAYQQQQQYWLQQVNAFNVRLAKIDPTKSHDEYAALERDMFHANESANLAYAQSLVARYQDQTQQMMLAVARSNSISLLSEIGDQVIVMYKQITRLKVVIKTRTGILQKHITFQSEKKNKLEQRRAYIQQLADVNEQYKYASTQLDTLSASLNGFRVSIDRSLQSELSARQGFPTYSFKTLLDLGKEMLLIPALTFKVVSSLSSHLIRAFTATNLLGWVLFLVMEAALTFVFCSLRAFLSQILSKPSVWRDRINSKWLSLQWLQRNLVDLLVIGNLTAVMYFFGIPLQNYIIMLYLSCVWLVFKCIITVARLCLVETTHDAAGHDMRLYHRLKWAILAGGIITALTVFVHQLPLIYELKTLCDQLFLLLLMVVSLFLLRSWHVVPTLVLSHMEARHPYLEKSIRLIGILVPLLMLGNSIIGLFGYVNLIMTVSRYEGLFLIVLIGYLILRGLLSDGMEQLSRLAIKYTNNGWLWTEAFLKPIDKVLRIALFLAGWAVLFLLYGWDKQSPIVERFTRLLHYELVHVLNTTITPLNIIALFVVMSVFYWTAKWIREFVYRALSARTKDMGIRNSIAILSQYSVVVLGAFFCLRVLGIDLRALAVVAGMFAFGVGLGLRDLANNFACGFLILLERPLRVGDIVEINAIEGEVTNIGSRAVTVRTWDHMELVVPNTEIFNKTFTNWTARDNTVRSVVPIKISRYDNPHAVKVIIQDVLAAHKDVLNEPIPEVYLKDMSDTLMEFELRFFVNIRLVKSRICVISDVLITIWDAFAVHGIKPPYPQSEIFLRGEVASLLA